MTKGSKASRRAKGQAMHAPLADQYEDDRTGASRVRTTPRVKDKARRVVENAAEIDQDMSAKIMREARLQQQEVQRDHEADRQRVYQALGFGAGGADDDDEIEIEFDDDMDARSEYDMGEDEYYREQDALMVTEEDERALAAFMNPDAPARQTLADIIMQKIQEKEERMAAEPMQGGRAGGGGGGGGGGDGGQRMDPRVAKMFRKVGKVLRSWKSGKLPKAFKLMPSLTNWEEAMYLTSPYDWTPHVMREAVRIFASNLNAKMCQRFFNTILLPYCRDDILQNKRLNYHLYMGLKKALFKPAAFFKGFLLPLCEDGDCSLREALIFGSVLGKISIPVLHTSAALLKIADMPYSGGNSIFIRTLLEKKYALPHRVIDSLVAHFARFRTETRELPVIWHQSLLMFVQRYKRDISDGQRDAIRDLLRCQQHHLITDEIRRELFWGRQDMHGDVQMDG